MSGEKEEYLREALAHIRVRNLSANITILMLCLELLELNTPVATDRAKVEMRRLVEIMQSEAASLP